MKDFIQKNKERLNKLSFSVLACIVGNMLYALTVKLFLLPSGLIVGGTTGIALTINHYTGLQISKFVLIFNIAMLILGLFILGRRLVITTLASSFLYPIFLECFDRLFGNVIVTEDLFLNTIFTGLGVGISLGLVIRSGSSTGGMDIPMLSLKKLFHIPVSVSMYVFDVLILLAQYTFSSNDKLLFGIIMALIYSIVLDKMLMLGSTRTQVKIISEKREEIRNAIIQDMDRGVTMIDGEGGYLHKEMQMVLSVISNRELPHLQKLIYQIDPECFMVVSRVTEVSGPGFSMKKRYR